MIKNLSVVFPLFNEENRLINTFRNIKKFNKKKSFKKIEYIFVNDGSTDNSCQKIIKFINESPSKKNIYKYLSLKKNFGKGYALKKGIEKSSYKWILTIDTDISVSLLELNNWVKKNYIEYYKPKIIYFGSRNLPNSTIKYKFHRKFLGFFFSSIVKILFKTSVNDTQCGFKLYKKEIAKILFKNLKSYRFTHDVEILNLAKKNNIKVKELPVNWTHKNNSKLNILIDPIKMFFELIYIRLIN